MLGCPGLELSSLSLFPLEGQAGPDGALDVQRSLVPTSPSSWQVDSGSQDAKMLSASQVAMHGGEGRDTALLELDDVTQPTVITC